MKKHKISFMVQSVQGTVSLKLLGLHLFSSSAFLVHHVAAHCGIRSDHWIPQKNYVDQKISLSLSPSLFLFFLSFFLFFFLSLYIPDPSHHLRLDSHFFLPVMGPSNLAP